jgi:hypothetical protein
MNMNFKQYDMMLTMDGSRKCLQYNEHRKGIGRLSQKFVGVEAGKRPDGGVNRECAKSTGGGFGFDVQLCQRYLGQDRQCVRREQYSTTDSVDGGVLKVPARSRNGHCCYVAIFEN